MPTTFTVQIDWDNDGSFATSGDDITAYVIEVPTVEIGMATTRDRVAAGGRATLVLNNEDKRFSPANTSGPYYGKLLPGRPVRIQATDGVDIWTLFTGVIRDIMPVPGALGGKRAVITCQDKIAQLQRAYVSLPVQRDRTADYLLKLIGSEAFKTARATGTLTFNTNPSDGDVVSVNDVTYTFKTALTPTANEVLIGDTAADSAENLKRALNAEDTAGTNYAEGTTYCKVARATIDGEFIDVPMAGNPQGFAIGRYINGYEYWEGQSFTIETGGLLNTIELYFGIRGGSPTGTVTWSIYEYDATNKVPVGSALETGVFTPDATEPAWNTVTASGVTYLTSGQYFLELKPTSSQTTGNYWVILASDGNAGDTYADGEFHQLQADPPSTWGIWTNQDMRMKITLDAQPVLTLTAVARGAWANSVPFSAGPNYVTNGDFSAGESGWAFWSDGTVVHEATNGKLSIYRNGGTNATFYQDTGQAMTVGDTVTLMFKVANTSSMTKMFHAVARDSAGYTGQLFETYYIAANTEETLYTWTKTATNAWANTRIEFHGFDDDGTPGLLFDDIELHINSDIVPSGGALSGGVDGPAGAFDYEKGKRTFGVAADTWTIENTTAMRAIIDVVDSEHGFYWASRAGTLMFKNTLWEFDLFDAAPALTINGTHVEMQSGMQLSDVYNRILVQYRPRTRLSEGVVAQSTSSINVPPGKGTPRRIRTNPSDDLKGEATTVHLQYIDPATGEPMGAEDLVLPLTPGTDYVVKNPEGQDITSKGFVSVAVAETASGVDVTLVSIRRRPLTVENLRVRGVGVVTYDPRTVTLDDADSQAVYGRQTATITLPLEAADAQNFAESLAAYTLGRWKNPIWRVETIDFGSDPVINNTNVFSVELGDVITISEDQTGTAAQRALVVGALYAMRENQSRVMFRVRRADAVTYWRLGDATYGMLGATTRLAI